MTDRSVAVVLAAPPPHWVGDGFHVSPLFGDVAFTATISPFLMLDWAAERRFAPARAARGVGPHPHRGFETVTLVHAGEVVHRDSAGHGGQIGPGDVQWMTAGSGLLHEELLGDRITRDGGAVSMAQLWVNLPARAKRAAPRYQPISAAAFPTVALGEVSLRVVAGDLAGVVGPAETHTPLLVADGAIAAGARLDLPVADGWTGLVAVLDGAIEVGGRRVAGPATVIFDRAGDRISLVGAAPSSRLLVLVGEPIDEPIAHMGPFVMNTHAELIEAIDDFRAGRMGALD